MNDGFPFHGIDTPFNLYNFCIILFSVLFYALLTSWIPLLAIRRLIPFIDNVGRKMLFMPGIFPLLLLVGGGLFYLAFPDAGFILVILVPILMIASLFGMAQSVIIVPLAFLFVGSLFFLVWAPFGALTGIGWVGMFPYSIFVFKSWGVLYPS